MSINQLYNTMVYPAKKQPVRLPTFPSVSRTAVLDLSSPMRISVGNSTRVMLSPQANYPVFMDYTCPTATPMAYVAGVTYASKSNAPYGVSDLGQPDNSVLLGYAPGVATTWGTSTNVTNPGSPAITSTTTYADPAFYNPILGVDESVGGVPFIYTPAATSTFIVVQAGSALSSIKVSLELEIWVAPGEVKRFSTGVVGGGANWQVAFTFAELTGLLSGATWVRPVSVSMHPAPPNGYVPVVHFFAATSLASFSLTGSTNGLTTIAVEAPAGGSTGFMPFPMPVDFYTSAVPWQNTRVTAAAIAMENVTKVMNKEGTIMCGRLHPSTTDPFNFSANTLAALHPLEKAQLPMERGIYTYCAPANSFDRFKDYSYPAKFTRSSTLTYTNIPTFNLSFDGMYNCLVLQDPDGGTLMSANLDYHLEFKSSSVLWPLAISKHSVEQLHSAVQRLANGPFFSPHKEAMRIGLPMSAQPSVYRQPRGQPRQRRQGRPKRAPPPSRQRPRVPGPARPKPNQTPQPTQKAKSPKPKGGLQMFLDSRRR